MTQLSFPDLRSSKINPLSIGASALYLGFVLLLSVERLINGSIGDYFSSWTYLGNLFEYGHLNALLGIHYLVFFPLGPLLAIAAAALGVISRKPILQLLLGAAIFFLLYVLPDILRALNGAPLDLLLRPYGLLDWLETGALLIAILLSGIAFLSSRATQPAQYPVSTSNDSVGPVVTPTVAAKSSGSYNNLPMFALIGAFIIPLAGIILGHLSLSYMKKGQLSTQNKGMATAGLILGYVFVGLGFLTGLILFIVLIVSAATGF
jgi:hypothetical protein